MMMTVVAMMGRGIGRNYRPGQNHNGNHGKKNHAQFHDDYSFRPIVLERPIVTKSLAQPSLAPATYLSTICR